MLPARFALLLVLAFAIGACGGDAEESSDSTVATGTGSTTVSATNAETVAEGCESVEAPEPKPDGGESAPEEELDEGTTYRLEVETNCGAFTITLDPQLAPETTASLVSLAEKGFFDGTTFHRVVPGFVIQGGDPTGTGAGGPGYSTVDPPPSTASYTQGIVAMAKTGVEAAGTSGSQFFVVTGQNIGLPPEYAIVGEVTEGLGAVLAIDKLGIADGPPSQPVVIERVTVTES